MGKLINADDFYFSLMEWAITDKDREFAEEVKYALDKQEPAEPMEIVKAFYNLPQDVRIDCCKKVYKHVD